MSLQWDYSPQIYSREDVERIGLLFSELLSAIDSGSKSPVGDLNYLSNAERQDLMRFRHAEIDEEGQCLHHVFSKQVAQAPGATALVDQFGSLDFGEVERRSNQLASYLQSKGVTVETRVGLCTTRGCNMIVALLGILKAGGAFVPLDPDFPSKRIQLLIQDSNISSVVTEEHLQEKIPAQVHNCMRRFSRRT